MSRIPSSRETADSSVPGTITAIRMMYYADGDIDAVMRGFQKLNPGQFSAIVESSLDEKLFLIRSMSDIDASKFWFLNAEHASGFENRCRLP